MTRRAVLVACLAVAAAAVGASASAGGTAKSRPLVVVTDKGAVSGVLFDGMRAFEGIPYAAPPVGNLRWRPPQAHARWAGTRLATRFSTACRCSPGRTTTSGCSSSTC